MTAARMPEFVERDYRLARLTTIRTGGKADYFARIGNIQQLEQVLSWAGSEAINVGTIGSGSNLLVADAGVRGLVVKLDGELAAIEQQGSQMLCGGGARLPQVSARAAALGLSGIEFGVNIPGTVGGAVRMNANAYGGELASVLEWVDVASSSGVERRTPDQLGFSYRRSNITASQVVARASFLLEPSTPEQVKKTLAAMRTERRAAQPSGIKTFGSTFKNPTDSRAQGATAGKLLEQAGAKQLLVGGARFSNKHANFIENVDGTATTKDVLELIEAGRQLVREHCGIELETEVQFMGER